MRLVRYRKGAEGAALGVLEGEGVVPIAALLPDAPRDMKALIAAWPQIGPKLASAKGKAIPLAEVTLLAPVAAPEKVMAIGMNYAEHAQEAADHGVAIPKDQVWFCKLVSSLNAPFGDVDAAAVVERLDYEVELVVIIGKGGRNISEAEAPGAVFGYAVGNDVSARDWQMKTAQWVLGKSFDTHGPFGPAIVTADEVGDPHALGIRSFVNGEQRQSSNTKHLIFNIWAQIVELSKVMTLKPGDLIFTGTPAGVGMAMKPPAFLKPGDVVRCEIDRLGAIENRVVADARPVE
jgi:ureidoglycolate lyase